MSFHVLIIIILCGFAALVSLSGGWPLRRAAFLLFGVTVGTWMLQQWTDIDRGAEMAAYVLCDVVMLRLFFSSGYIREFLTGLGFVIAHVTYSLYELIEISKPKIVIVGYYGTLSIVTLLLALFFIWRAPIVQELKNALVGMGHSNRFRRHPAGSHRIEGKAE